MEAGFRTKQSEQLPYELVPDCGGVRLCSDFLGEHLQRAMANGKAV